MGAKSGLDAPTRERTVISRDMVEISTPSPRAKMDKNGYTILWAVFRIVRRNMKVMSWKRIRKVFYSLAFRVRKYRVKKYAATHARMFNPTKKAITLNKPELKMGDGGGCITF